MNTQKQNRMEMFVSYAFTGYNFPEFTQDTDTSTVLYAGGTDK